MLETEENITKQSSFVSWVARWRSQAPWALGARLALRTGLALNTGLALRTHLAARAVGTASPRMTLRSRPSRLALLAARARWPLSSLPARQIVRQLRTPAM